MRVAGNTPQNQDAHPNLTYVVMQNCTDTLCCQEGNTYSVSVNVPQHSRLSAG